MKVWIFEIGEPLAIEKDVRLHRYGLFSKYLSKKGHEVTLWTSTFSHTPKRNFFTEDVELEIDGVIVKLFHGQGYKKNISLKRIMHNKEFTKRVLDALYKCDDWPDVIILPIPIIEVAYEISKLAKEMNIPTIVDIRDEWPDEILNLAPRILRPILKMLLIQSYRKMTKLINNATVVTGVSQRQCDYGLSFSSSRTESFVFPHGYPKYQISDSTLNGLTGQLKAQFNFSQYDFNCCFFGSMGRYFDLSVIIDAAKRLPKMGFILAGDGQNRQRLLERAKDVPNVYLPGWLNQNQIQSVMSVCDIGLAPYIRSDSFSLPNKPIEYMSGGLALLSSIQGEVNNLIENEGIGTTIANLNKESVRQHLLEMTRDRQNLEHQKARSKALFEHRFESEYVLNQAVLNINHYIEK